MSRQRSRDTKPEVAVRRLLHAAGLRYRLQRRVPGMARNTIDIAFPGPRVAVFIDGCFWHGCPEHATYPKANSQFWHEKINKNAGRDARTTAHLESLGWTVLRFWEHEKPEQVATQVEAVLQSAKHVRRPTPGSR
ncbi:very short patch repair endonuclease [Streptomyces sp. NBC_01381]|uniref:very short patch repair endonuclease n=1 Tax=Streptomyces sp. NBC_01381 TaxID=2903845 RepID=UPI002259637C|nr:very short patch repair endonuclease [Streptomyces sp. NBC_01381]MCX4666986.1 very short patch repair endonuclease [Streptomyces sp. NBC_01381]